jgi:streptomycin 6-kinase
LRYGRRVHEDAVSIDPGTRQRLALRFGSKVGAWFDELPGVIRTLAERWRFELGPQIPRGSVSAVFRCRIADGRRAVLKLSPDRTRLAQECAALGAWISVHVPKVIRFDEQLGALLMEAIDPGTPLSLSADPPSAESLGELVRSLQAGSRDPSFPSVERRVEYLFASSAKLYERDPALAEVISTERYARGQALAERLAREQGRDVLLHGDLTPNNILDGGEERGLVAIDPAPCIGDAAFDAVDLVLWQADSLATIEARAERLAYAIGVDASAVLSWCVAFAGMNALELASQEDGDRTGIEALVGLASRVDGM